MSFFLVLGRKKVVRVIYRTKCISQFLLYAVDFFILLSTKVHKFDKSDAIYDYDTLYVYYNV